MTVGIVGLGDMGGGMMDRLLLAKRTAFGYNRTAAKAQPFAERGMHVVDSPRALVEACDLIVTMVTNDAALEAVAGGEGGILAGMRAGKTWVDMSTISPDAMRELERRVAREAGTVLGAAVLGSPLTIARGQLLIMIGGDEEACARVTPALEDIGPTVRRVGDAAQAKVMKIALNLNLPVQMLALSEGVLLAEKSGIKRETALEIMLGGVVASPMLAYRAPFILDMPDKAWFDVGMMQKDLNLALRLGQEVGVPLPTTSVANEMLTASSAIGLQDFDFAVLFHTLARMAGIDSSPR
jgi:3-hydroxyisobutyrate dehydrogenase-like beta-hydroxyacid dehydrogenase